MRLDKALDFLPEDTVPRGLRGRRRLCEKGLIVVNGRTVDPGLRVRSGDAISLLHNIECDPALFLKIRYIQSSNGFTAFFKPSGLHSASLSGSHENSFEDWLKKQPCHQHTVLLNRLDRATSGILITAHDEKSVLRWHQWENAGQVRKTYIAVAEGCLRQTISADWKLDSGNRKKVRILHNEHDALRETIIVPLAPIPHGRFPFWDSHELTLIQCLIRKGARHQIRAHTAFCGYPLAGDTLYGAQTTGHPFLLHHARLEFPGFAADIKAEWEFRVSDSLPERKSSS
ncbi:MAG: pseudouridine synthase [Desulfovibrionaceae bacterium]|nr:pseudouridine synthase [Desulfovibrionaceae bacterium]